MGYRSILKSLVETLHATSVHASLRVQTLHATSLLLILLVLSCNHDPTIVTFQTDMGNVVVELDMENAPITASNFLDHVKKGSYRNSMFYRVVNDQNQAQSQVKIDVIQGGLFHDSIVDNIATIIHETTEMTGIKHLDGTISMARLGPGTASTEFFICVGDQPELDFQGLRNPDKQGFAAFGKVISGMEVVSAIHQLPNTDQYLDQFVIISNIIEE